MEKKQLLKIMTGVFLLIMTSLAGQGLAIDERIFLTEIENAVDQTISAWIAQDQKALEAALGKLALNEAYLLAVGKSNKNNSYLALVPNQLSKRAESAAAYIYLIKKNRNGINLFPKTFFEGKQFEYRKVGK